MLLPTRRLLDIGAEAALITGGGRAILLQLANPAIGHAIARHSGFTTDPLKRLRHTLTFVYALTYGSPQQRARATAHVNRAHAPVVSAPDDTPSYRATDAALQLWVAATLYDTAARVYSLVIGKLTDAELDAVYADYEAVGSALQVPRGMWPKDRAAFDAYWRAELELLSVDDTVLQVTRALLHPTSGPVWLRAGMPLARLITAGLMPAQLRSAFELPWGPRRARRFTIAIRIVRTVNRMLPRGIRHWPKNYLLAKL